TVRAPDSKSGGWGFKSLLACLLWAGASRQRLFHEIAMLQETYEKAVQFLRDVRSEVRKVTFPSRQETLASTVVVLAAVSIISVYLGIVDLVLARVLHSIFR